MTSCDVSSASPCGVITVVGDLSPSSLQPCLSLYLSSSASRLYQQCSLALTSFFNFPSPITPTLLLFPFGAGLILGVLLLVYVTVLVTISLTCLTPLLLILGLSPRFASKYLALFGPVAASQSKCERALKGERTALVQDEDIGFADIGVAEAERGEVISLIDHAGEAGMWRCIRPELFRGAEAGTLGRAKVGFEAWEADGGGDFMEHPLTLSNVIDDKGVTVSEAGTEVGETEREESSDVELLECESMVIVELLEMVEASELFRENGGG